MRRRLFAVTLSAAALLGAAQLATDVLAAPRPDPCAGVRCMACPDGTVFSPTKGNCCRCVPAH